MNQSAVTYVERVPKFSKGMINFVHIYQSNVNIAWLFVLNVVNKSRGTSVKTMTVYQLVFQNQTCQKPSEIKNFLKSSTSWKSTGTNQKYRQKEKSQNKCQSGSWKIQHTKVRRLIFLKLRKKLKKPIVLNQTHRAGQFRGVY